jgi:hypothetical protein
MVLFIDNSITTIEGNELMKKTVYMMLLAFTLGTASTAFAGGPKSSHPCYDVADCKSQGSKEEFSACIKENKAEADDSAACAAFRGDKEGYMKLMGMSNLDELFE